MSDKIDASAFLEAKTQRMAKGRSTRNIKFAFTVVVPKTGPTSLLDSVQIGDSGPFAVYSEKDGVDNTPMIIGACIDVITTVMASRTSTMVMNYLQHKFKGELLAEIAKILAGRSTGLFDPHGRPILKKESGE